MKLLVISHNPVSRYNAMGKTIASFLAAMKPEEVCQLYLYPSYPCPQICGSFYRITDKDVLRGLPGGKIVPERIDQDASGFSSREDAARYGTVLKNKPPVRLAREILWGSASWYTRALRSWLEQEQPDCIFAAGGNAAFLYQMALTLSRDYGLPLIAYLCDEYYFSAPEKGLTGRAWHLLRRRNMEKFLNHAAHALVISPEMKRAYASYYYDPDRQQPGNPERGADIKAGENADLCGQHCLWKIPFPGSHWKSAGSDQPKAGNGAASGHLLRAE